MEKLISTLFLFSIVSGTWLLASYVRGSKNLKPFVIVTVSALVLMWVLTLINGQIG